MKFFVILFIIIFNLTFIESKEYISITAAAKSMNIYTSAILNVLAGRSKTAKGFYWTYKHEK